MAYCLRHAGLPFGENGVCKRNRKSAAGAQAKRGASGDRLISVKCAEGLDPKPCSRARDRYRMAKTLVGLGEGTKR